VTDQLATGVAWLDAQRKAHMASAVTYTRGGTSLSITATAARTEYESGDEQGVRVAAEMQDWIVTAADLAGLGVPVAGDQIISGARTFEVMNLGTENCWRWTDGFSMSLRIHTKETGA
jgi:hypothetical protein